jgi:hypothetical protein
MGAAPMAATSFFSWNATRDGNDRHRRSCGLSSTVALAFCILLTGCSGYKLRTPAVPPIDPFGLPGATSARVCVVRTTLFGSNAISATRDNGQLVGATRGPGHFCWYAEPGVHEVVVEADGRVTATLQAERGKTYYFKEEVRNVLSPTPEIIWIDLPEARDAITTTPYQVLVNVPKEEVLPDDAPFVHAKTAAGMDRPHER